MASLTIRNLDDRVKARLRAQAARHGRSMEEEAREILKLGVALSPGVVPNDPEEKLSFYESIRRHVEPFGGIELKIPPRQPIRRPPSFD